MGIPLTNNYNCFSVSISEISMRELFRKYFRPSCRKYICDCAEFSFIEAAISYTNVKTFSLPW